VEAPYAPGVIVHLNGELIPAGDARISPFDRGFIFGDGVYEGLRSVPDNHAAARVIGLGAHARRMQAGLDEAGIRWEAGGEGGIGPATLALLRANDLREAFIYWQVTRGTPPGGEPVRSRVPAPGSRMRPTVFAYCSPQPALASVTAPPTKRAVVLRDRRWELGHLKSISLVANVMAAVRAAEGGADEAVLVRERGGAELVTEGLATNVFLAVKGTGGGIEIVTPALKSAPMLAGITRGILLREVPGIVERAVRSSELVEASEVMLVGTTTLVSSVVELDGRRVGGGEPGPVAKKLLGALLGAIRDRRDDQ
jgi:D-alanine transaminase